MLTFFRRIRKGLLGSGQARKYLLYAIGEIALVVIGILIALQINNWNEWRKDRVKEKTTLIEIKSNIESNIKLLDQAIDLMDLVNKSGSYILNAIDNKAPYNDSMNYHFFLAVIPGHASVEGLSTAGFEQYKNAGFDIITNDSLKQEIIHHFEAELPQAVSIILQREPNVSNYAEYQTRNFRLPDRFSSLHRGTGYVPIDYSSLINDEYCYNMYAGLNWFRGFRIAYASTLKESCESLLHRVNQQLDED